MWSIISIYFFNMVCHSISDRSRHIFSMLIVMFCVLCALRYYPYVLIIINLSCSSNNITSKQTKVIFCFIVALHLAWNIDFNTTSIDMLKPKLINFSVCYKFRSIYYKQTIRVNKFFAFNIITNNLISFNNW